MLSIASGKGASEGARSMVGAGVGGLGLLIKVGQVFRKELKLNMAI